ncbi:MAG: 50S ribosomal protein L23 [Crocinitomicaceae bacterium]|jgi:large subunit ribosomal protein L23|nr:MAG: 50S ribosomal protein L23 [Crocinitomicaceae bacterium]
MNIIIRKPLITEKATAASEARNLFTFEVAKSANKIEIKKAVEKMYGVTITKVRTMTYGGGKSSIKQTNRGIVVQPNNPWKKAIVTVADGETIDLFNNI